MRGVIEADKLIGLSLLICLGVLVAIVVRGVGGYLGQSLGPIVYDAGNVSDERIKRSQQNEPEAWLSYGQSYEERRYSTLTQIDRETAPALGLAWYRDIDQRHRLQGTPLVVDGVMYFTDAWSVVYAVDAASGEELWTFDPQTRRQYMRYSCCGGPSNQGVAVHSGKVFVATFDGRLLAIDASNGEALWDVDTQDADALGPVNITAAPRVASGKVFIGQSGSASGQRGYVSAYDVESGELAWRFWLVPGDPSQPFEHPEMAQAVSTWSGNWWEMGGGGVVSNAIVYDPDLHSLYLGVGNGAPWSRDIRSPGGGDNLFLSSIVAVDPDSGRMKWYYQTVPGDNWDYSAVMDMALTEMEVEGEVRQVLVQASNNGYFYVIDRQDGKVLRADPYSEINWALGVDMNTGRPVENPEARYEERPQWILPGKRGAHNNQAMAIDASKTTAYIASNDDPYFYALPESFVDGGGYDADQARLARGLASGDYRQQLIDSATPGPEPRALLRAFDYSSGAVKWEAPSRSDYNGGTLSTAGGLVFQGDGAGYVNAYHDDSGELLWEFATHGAIGAPPITYSIQGRQYVAIMAGVSDANEGGGRLLVFTLGGVAELPAPVPRDLSIPPQAPVVVSENELARGSDLYAQECATCHGAQARAGSMAPDLRRMDSNTHALFQEIVRDGLYAHLGVESFAEGLSEMEAELVQQYIIWRASQDRAEQLEQ